MGENGLSSLEQEKVDKEAALNEWFPRKIKMAKEFIDEEATQKSRNMAKGAVHLCELGENIGSEQNEERPVLIISNDRINSTSSNVLVIPLTKNLKKKRVKNRQGKEQIVPKIRTHFFLNKSKYTFLTYDSAAMAECMRSVSKIRLGKHLGNITSDDIEKILSRVKWIFDM